MLVWETIQDPVIILLIVAATVRSGMTWRGSSSTQTSLLMRTIIYANVHRAHGMQVSTIMGAAIPQERVKGGWVEGAAIWVAVFIVVGVGAGNDWQKARLRRQEMILEGILRFNMCALKMNP